MRTVCFKYKLCNKLNSKTHQAKWRNDLKAHSQVRENFWPLFKNDENCFFISPKMLFPLGKYLKYYSDVFISKKRSWYEI